MGFSVFVFVSFFLVAIVHYCKFSIDMNNAEDTKKNEIILTWLHWHIIMLYEIDGIQKKTDIVRMVLKAKIRKGSPPPHVMMHMAILWETTQYNCLQEKPHNPPWEANITLYSCTMYVQRIALHVGLVLNTWKDWIHTQL